VRGRGAWRVAVPRRPASPLEIPGTVQRGGSSGGRPRPRSCCPRPWSWRTVCAGQAVARGWRTGSRRGSRRHGSAAPPLAWWSAPPRPTFPTIPSPLARRLPLCRLSILPPPPPPLCLPWHDWVMASYVWCSPSAPTRPGTLAPTPENDSHSDIILAAMAFIL